MLKRGKQSFMKAWWNFKSFHMAYHIKRRSVILFSIILVLGIYFFKDASWILRTVATIAFMVVFYTADHAFDLRFKRRHYIYAVIIAVSGSLLSPLYYIYPNYDKVQHFFQPILITAIIFYMISELPIERKHKITLSFFVTVGILGLFEIGEFGLDSFFNLKLQGVYLRDINGLDKFNLIMDPLSDTMWDLILGTIGSLLYSGFQFTKGKIKPHSYY